MNNNTAYIFIGHGTLHHANSTYSGLEARCRERGIENIFIGTIEGYPPLSTVIKNPKLSQYKYKRAVLTPLLFVAGDHAHNDIFGNDDSWKKVMEQNGYEVDVILKGLGEYKSIRDIYIQHIDEVIK